MQRQGTTRPDLKVTECLNQKFYLDFFHFFNDIVRCSYQRFFLSKIDYHLKNVQQKTRIMSLFEKLVSFDEQKHERIDVLETFDDLNKKGIALIERSC